MRAVIMVHERFEFDMPAFAMSALYILNASSMPP